MSSSVDRLLEDIVDAVDLDPSKFTSWEIDFIDSVSDRNAEGKKITEAQMEKLRELHDKT